MGWPQREYGEGAVIESCAVAWAAGVFEGEGSFFVHRGRNGRVYLALAVQMSDLDVLERVRDALGIDTRIYSVRRAVLRQRDRKQIYAFQVSGKKAIAAGEVLRPWLGHRRRLRLDEILAQVAANPPSRYPNRVLT